MRRCLLVVAAVSVCALLLSTSASAGVFKVDFGAKLGAASGWDEIDYLSYVNGFGPGNWTPFTLTDWSGGGDDDVLMTAGDDPPGDDKGDFDDSNSGNPNTSAVVADVTVPSQVFGDYFFKSPDTAGTSARIRFDNLDPGVYAVTVFEGRNTDSNGQYAKIWVGDATGSNEPASQNTGNYAGGASSTLLVTIASGDYLWYRHLEDNTGGTSGIIITPEPGSFVLLASGLLGLLLYFRRRR